MVVHVMYKLFVDSGESTLNKIFRDQGIDVHTKKLDVGDILITDENDKVFVVIERKTISDLSASIKDGRLHEQKARLLLNFPSKNIMYIIEDYNSFDTLRDRNIESSIIHSMFRDEIHVGFSKNATDTVAFIVALFERVKAHPEYFSKKLERDTSKSYFSIQGIKKSCNNTVANVNKSMLCQIPGISEQTCNGILDIYLNVHSLIKTMYSKSYDECQNELCNIKINNRRISKTVVKNILMHLHPCDK